MTPWWWLLITAAAAGSLGALIMAILSAGKRSDEWNDVMMANNLHHNKRMTGNSQDIKKPPM